jgi:phospholipid transport system substrate-binding protein
MRIARQWIHLSAASRSSTVKKFIRWFFATALLFGGAVAGAADMAPDALVKSVADEVLVIIKDNKDPQTLRTLAEQKVLPHFDFEKMTQLAAGRIWRDASASQQQSLVNGFRALLVNTYVTALSRNPATPKSVEVKPVAQGAVQGEALVKTLVAESGKPPIAIDYRMNNGPTGWKVVDVTVENVSLVSNYRSTFSQEVARSGIDGLIKSLEEKTRTSVKG